MNSIKLIAVAATTLALTACFSLPAGPAGATGAKGTTGYTGATGSTGNTGARGATTKGDTLVIVPAR